MMFEFDKSDQDASCGILGPKRVKVWIYRLARHENARFCEGIIPDVMPGIIYFTESFLKLNINTCKLPKYGRD